MTQDTRKDRRVKIVSLNVRYKSATVDEFIENHAHDVSRGGIYIKTGNPFPQGTLLKFEIRLASDQTVITGVGRVVWKREAAQGEQPAGMGVKFIKVDDSSKVVIDRLVSTRSDAGKAFESELDPTALPRSGSGAESMAPQSSPAGTKRQMTPHKPASSAGPPPLSRSAAPGSRPSSPPRPVAPSPLFPKAMSGAPEAPKQEQTVMKQAAELLEEALREAGGSMEEVGTNPLFSGAADPVSKEATASGASKAPERLSQGPVKAIDEGAAARGMVAALSPGHSGSKGELGGSPRQAAVSSSIAAPPRKRGSILGPIVGVIAVVAIGVVVFNRDKLFGGAPDPAPSAAALPLAPSAPLAVEAPPPSAAPTAASPAIDAAPSEPSAAPAPASASSASAAPSSKPPAAAAITAPSPPPVQAAKPAAPAAPASASTPTPSATPQAPAAPTPAAADSSQGAAASPAPSATSRTPKPAVSAVVKAPTKPAKPAENDNPY
jgi:uncharacterized protein (TIGR02266 family)